MIKKFQAQNPNLISSTHHQTSNASRPSPNWSLFAVLEVLDGGA
jgi:hypothetical protein